MTKRWITVLVIANIALLGAVALQTVRIGELERSAAPAHEAISPHVVECAARFGVGEDRRHEIERVLQRHVGPIGASDKAPPKAVWRAACSELRTRLSAAELAAGGCP